jgi:hypothetical protein
MVTGHDRVGAVAGPGVDGVELGRCGVGSSSDEGHAIPAEPFGGLTHGLPGAPADAVVLWCALVSGGGFGRFCVLGERDPDEVEIATVMDG